MKFREKKLRHAPEHGVRDRWIIPYADLVTILLALFVVLYAAADNERAAVIASSFKGVQNGGSGILPDGASPKKHELTKEILSDPILSSKAKLSETSSEVTVSLADSALFQAAESEVETESRKTLRLIAAKLSKSKGSIRIEGHTDSTPISNRRFRSNWELSTARASSVLMLLIEYGVQPNRLSASGYGGFRPIADNSSIEGRRLNRRVDIVIEQKKMPLGTLVRK